MCGMLHSNNTVTQGGRSMLGFGAQATLSDVVSLYSVAEKSYKISELVSITDGPFCYTYA
jgi:tyrosinase